MAPEVSFLTIGIMSYVAKALKCEEDTDESENIIARAIGRSMRRGLSDIWPRKCCFSSGTSAFSRRSTSSYHAAACILALLTEPLQFFIKDNDDPQVHEAVIRLGKDLPLTDVEACFRRVVPKSRPTREAHGRYSADRRPGCSSRRRCRAPPPWAASRTLWWTRAGRGAVQMHGIVAASRLCTAIAATTRKQTRRHAPLFFAEPGLRSSGAGSSRPKTRCRTSWIGYWLYRPIENGS